MRVARENGTLTVFCDDCGSRIAWVKGDCIILKKKHHGQSHTTVLPLLELIKLEKAGDIKKLVKALS